MGKLAMEMLRNAAISNFKRGNLRFKFTQKCTAEIVHRHHNEYGVTVFDPIAQQDCEVLRIYDGKIPYCV